MIELPNKEEIEEWIDKSYNNLNPDVKPFFIMGIEALYVKLGGEKFIHWLNKEKE